MSIMPKEALFSSEYYIHFKGRPPKKRRKKKKTLEKSQTTSHSWGMIYRGCNSWPTISADVLGPSNNRKSSTALLGKNLPSSFKKKKKIQNTNHPIA